jgi:hypothetical protein
MALGLVVWGIGQGAMAHAAPIYRGFLSLHLGMPIDAFLETTPAQEIPGEAGERLFSVTRVINELDGVVVAFVDHRLARVEVTYSAAYASRTTWDEFVAMAVRKYGTGFHLPTPGGEVEMWDDGRTTLILERRSLTSEGHTYGLTLQDDAIALEQGGSCAPRIDV